jgi:hypothetical protein
MTIKKVFLTVQIATISNLSENSILSSHNYETDQPKIGLGSAHCRLRLKLDFFPKYNMGLK